jgi:hypothetical protein
MIRYLRFVGMSLFAAALVASLVVMAGGTAILILAALAGVL